MAAARCNDQKRLEEELRKVEIEINEEKTRVVDFGSGGSFGFLGFDLRAGRNRFGKRFVLRTPMRKKQSELIQRVGTDIEILPASKTQGSNRADSTCDRGLGQLLSGGQLAPSV